MLYYGRKYLEVVERGAPGFCPCSPPASPRESRGHTPRDRCDQNPELPRPGSLESAWRALRNLETQDASRNHTTAEGVRSGVRTAWCLVLQNGYSAGRP